MADSKMTMSEIGFEKRADGWWVYFEYPVSTEEVAQHACGPFLSRDDAETMAEKWSDLARRQPGAVATAVSSSDRPN